MRAPHNAKNIHMVVGRKSTQRKAGGKEEACHNARCGKATPCQLNSSHGERQGTHQNKTGQKSELGAPVIPELLNRQKLSKVSDSVNYGLCCCSRGGINLLLNEVGMMKVILTLTLTWSG